MIKHFEETETTSNKLTSFSTIVLIMRGEICKTINDNESASIFYKYC